MAETAPHAEQAQSQPLPRIGRDEMNLADFPIALLADRVPKGQKTLYFEDKHGRLTVTGSDAYGLPTATDTDVIVALIYLTKLRNDFRDEKVNFSRYELIKLLNWSDESFYYKRLEQSFHRWSGVLLVYDKCWWNNKTRRYVSANMHIIDSVVFAEPGGRGRGQSPLPLSTFTWNKTFIESCQADNLRQLDLDTYFSLKSAVSKRLYRFLGKRFYRQDDWTFDLDEIAFDRIGLSRNYGDAYKIKEKLQPAIEELEAIGFLRPLPRDDRYARVDRGQWTIRLIRHSPTLVAPLPSAPPAGAPEPPPLVAELTNRGVTKTTAVDLARDYPAQRIRQKIEVFDFLTEKQDRRIATSPAGYLVKSIEQDYAPPKGFISSADRKRQAEERQARQRQEAEDRRRKQEEEARDRAERKAADAYWAALSEQEQAELQAKADALADPADLARETGAFQRMGQQIQRNEYIRHLLKCRESVPAEA
jgi:Replication initiator protein A